MIRKAAFFSYLILITLLSLWPSDDLPDIELFPHADKIIHIGMYAGFTFLMFWTWREKLKGIKQFLPLLIVLVWGLLMELLQQSTGFGRSSDYMDILANCLGFIPGWLAWKLCERMQLSRK